MPLPIESTCCFLTLVLDNPLEFECGVLVVMPLADELEDCETDLLALRVVELDIDWVLLTELTDLATLAFLSEITLVAVTDDFVTDVDE